MYQLYSQTWAVSTVAYEVKPLFQMIIKKTKQSCNKLGSSGCIFYKGYKPINSLSILGKEKKYP